VQWELWHIAREAVSNAVRHSHGRRIDVRLRIRKDALTLEVVDDGDGFDPAAEVGPTHRGLRNMRHRAESLGGRIRVTSASGKGTTLAIHVPFGAEGGAVE
jgi:signal transduction histidine kinase